jgi:hypothetical protein
VDCPWPLSGWPTSARPRGNQRAVRRRRRQRRPGDCQRQCRWRSLCMAVLTHTICMQWRWTKAAMKLMFVAGVGVCIHSKNLSSQHNFFNDCRAHRWI